MAGSVTLTVEADVATWSSGIAAGAGPHLPVGQYSSADYRSAMRFPKPAGWTGWSAITKATLSVYISDHQHVGPKNSAIYVSRMTEATLWTKSAGTWSCDDGFSGTNNTQYDDIQSTGTDRVSFNSGSTPNTKKSINVTAAVRYYWSNDTAKIVFVFDNNGSDQYTELWADEKSGYNATLEIEYETGSVPLAPTVTAPAAGGTSGSTTPTFSWIHNDPEPQVNAEVRLYNAAGTTLISTWPVAGAAASLVAPTPLTPGTTYQFEVRTADATGYGLYSTKRSFSITALPIVTIDPVRYMELANGAARLRVKWSSNATQAKFRVQAGAFDSGFIDGPNASYLLSTVALVNGTPVSVTVTVETAAGLQGSATASFTPRYGLTTHRKDLGATPTNWGTPDVSTLPMPADASLKFEYGSSATADPAPPLWLGDIGAVPLARYLYWRAWFLPNNTQGPVLDALTIPTDAIASALDKWGPTRDTPGLAPPWSMSGNEYVYGTRSIKADVSGPGPFYCYAYAVTVRGGRSYILTGLMKSIGDSGACIELQDAAGNTLQTAGDAPEDVRTDVLTEDTGWYTSDLRDVVRHRTPVWVATSDMTVYVTLKVGGTAGAMAWFDAIKLEESTVATPWSPAAVGATVIDAGGVQIDGQRGGVFRYRGSAPGDHPRNVVEGGPAGLVFGTDTEITSPSIGVIAINGVPISGGTFWGPLMVNNPNIVTTTGEAVYVPLTTGAGEPVMLELGVS